jgi:glucose/mannose transport system permease protein
MAAAFTRRRRRWDTDRILSILLISPSIIAIGVFVYGFIAWTGFAALSRWDDIIPDLTFVGLRNFERLFDNPRFQQDISNTIVFTLAFVTGCILVGLGLAILLDQKIRGEIIFRNIFLFPMAVSFVVTGVVWRWMENPNSGLNKILDVTINPVLTALGGAPLHPGWFIDPNIGILGVALAAGWQFSGYVMALYLAGLRAIPEELREAARVDGATELETYRHIIMPLLNPITLSMVIILGHISLKIFDLTSAMTGTGPGFIDDVPAFFMFDTTFRGNHFAQGAAIAVFLLVAVSVLVVPYLIYNVRTETER